MYVELIYDQRNVKEIKNARQKIEDELTRRVHRVFPDADVRVKPMQANSINSDFNKAQKEKVSAIVQEMFDEADGWLVNEE
ncbi:MULTISPECIES: DinI-like family protein [unclassified Erwinia]|uniref:DinI-like family protein n=1 Tax=unclassified Erwinia TaxID=2622719 RepID=UPI000C18EB79|nr:MULTISPECIES: DinI-like family protein [unclassified Erwinia]PIJ48385.1 hypothetical protein BV501_17350 [Erwinia sp. OAMSP11]PIJ79878.1 DinI family protein [Erwinia sp. OLCASP19]PIJ81046.1 DinI family protein [Erwinia sp. OLMTSP26]PIJ93102.1 DinI family protein [Erwinia sp. OLFS4]